MFFFFSEDLPGILTEVSSWITPGTSSAIFFEAPSGISPAVPSEMYSSRIQIGISACVSPGISLGVPSDIAAEFYQGSLQEFHQAFLQEFLLGSVMYFFTQVTFLSRLDFKRL